MPHPPHRRRELRLSSSRLAIRVAHAAPAYRRRRIGVTTDLLAHVYGHEYQVQKGERLGSHPAGSRCSRNAKGRHCAMPLKPDPRRQCFWFGPTSSSRRDRNSLRIGEVFDLL